MNGRKLSVNKACLFLAVLLLVAMGTVSAALYGLTQNITAVWYVVHFAPPKILYFVFSKNTSLSLPITLQKSA